MGTGSSLRVGDVRWAACVPSCTRRAALSQRNPRHSSPSQLGWLEEQFRAAGHEEDARELSAHLCCAFQGIAAVAHAANDPDLVVMEVKRLKDWIGHCETERSSSRCEGQRGNGTMKGALDKGQFRPWALVIGASSAIGKEFARQIAASGL